MSSFLHIFLSFSALQLNLQYPCSHNMHILPQSRKGSNRSLSSVHYYDLLSNALYNVIQIKYWIAPFSMLDRTEELRENCLEEGRESPNQHQETHKCWRISSSSSLLNPWTSSWLFFTSINSLMNPTLNSTFLGTFLYLIL